MSNGKTRLQLTWIGKENQPRLEPRILIEEPEKSYHAPFWVSDKDIFDNRLIFGDNLLALKPPFNTQQAMEHYDGVEHSIWLTLMRDRLEILHRLLASDDRRERARRGWQLSLGARASRPPLRELGGRLTQRNGDADA